MSQVDLHIHSTASDGRLTPDEVVRKSVEAELLVIALTDHDTVAGVVPALEAGTTFPWLKVIPGVELSTDTHNGEVHILGYFVDYTNQELQTALESFRHSRRRRAQRMIANLANLGIAIDWQRVQEIAGGDSIGRPHIAQALLEKGYVTSIKEAFAKYIGWGESAYAARDKMTPSEAVELVLRAGGLPVLAHPLTIHLPEAMVIELKRRGLVGIEAYYAGYTSDEKNSLAGLAKKHGLIATGGSDYHGLDADNETMIGGADVPLESAEKLIAQAERLRAARP